MEFNATFLVSVISFILFTVIMNKIFYKPIENIINNRQKFIDDLISDAKKNNHKAEIIIKDKDEKLAKSRQDAKKLIADKLDEAVKDASESKSNAVQKFKNELTSAKELLKNEAETEKKELDYVADELAQIIVRKVTS